MALVRRCPQLSLRVDLPEVPDQCHQLSIPSTFLATNMVSEEVHCLSDLEKLQILGRGNCGTVYKVCHKRTQSFYALKKVSGNNNAARDQILQEIEILRSISSPFLVGCHGIFEEPTGNIAIVLEYMENGSLDSLLKTHGTFSEASLVDIALQVLKGLNYLHAMNIIHCDIKPSNLLVNRKMEIKIGDFGVSKVLNPSLDSCNTTYAGTCAYMSPERLDHDLYGSSNAFSGDVWSLGLCLMELYIGHYPYSAPNEKLDSAALMLIICLDDPPSLPVDASNEFKSFIQCCLQKEPSKRWSVSELLSHPFVMANEYPKG